ncbi:Hypothetical predicted protein [Xyrichtys novacula]|uniref:Uncharacterized protein n=1 Tax=Xyrichtys novacula TaxID=13765 RepID=A0AAV1GSQ6_XYRNO|nr:Hypothetical predicted protein [Xyrichtys novacula]
MYCKPAGDLEWKLGYRPSQTGSERARRFNKPTKAQRKKDESDDKNDLNEKLKVCKP